METFAKLFEPFLVFVYHCFDRIVIQGYLPLLSRSEHIVYFFRDVHGIYPITPQALAKRTPEYRGWVEGYARNHKIPMMSPDKDESKEEFVRPHLQRMERQNKHGVYFIILSMEMGRTSARSRRNILPMTRTIASSGRAGPATCIITFTFVTLCSAHCPWVSVRTSHFRPPTT